MDALADAPGGVTNPRAEIGRLQAELETEREARLRMAAEYQNYRRRTEQEKTRAADHGKHELLTGILAVADDLDLALERSAESPETIVEGVKMIRRRFLDILESHGVSVFESEGERFDPERHEAFDVVEDGNGESGTIHDQMRPGYFWNDRLLRPALVVVRK